MAEKSKGEIIRYAEQKPLDRVEPDLLAIVGFTPQLGHYMKRVNDILTKLMQSQVRGFTFTLTPDYENPKLHVETHYEQDANSD